MKSQKVKNPQEYPKVITDLPEAIIQVKGIKAWVLQGEMHQLVFFEMEPQTQVPEHSHDYPQWGIMLKGKMQLTIDGKTHLIKKGDEYVIPAGAKHYATFLSKCRVIDFFSEKTRYKTKPTKQR
ncbi:MAG TPA: cupin domain-containing protein [Candidatus Krumholzibacteriaceae bacterium]|nr:cupin domain-containing protein [Candidatus Krumholzibacteriaceae bacterium]